MIIHGQDDDRPSMDWVFDEEAAAAVDCRFRYKLKRGNGHTALVLLWVDVIDSISAAARRKTPLT